MELLKSKACVKQAVFRKTKETFEILAEQVEHLALSIDKEISSIDTNVHLNAERKGDYETRLYFSGDLLLFHMHTNAFGFDQNHGIKKLTYVKEDPSRAYCGIINIYNFLADSFRFNRVNDLGLLVARIFVNKDGHFYVEGPKHIGVLFNNFSKQEVSKEAMNKVVTTAMDYSMKEDLLTPPFQYVKEVQVHQMQSLSSELRVRTAKKLGFKMQGDSEIKG